MFRSFETSDPAIAPEGLRFLTVKSAALDQRADITLYTPPAMGPDTPICILLHGVYGSHWAWAFKGGAHHTAGRLIGSGAIRPMVLAMPSDGLWGDGSGYVPHAQQDFERWIIDEVPAAVRQACVHCTPASPLLLAGLSMGGFGALRLAGKHPQRLAAAAAHSTITDASQLDALIEEPRRGWSPLDADTSVLQALRQATGPLPPLRLDCGTDDFLLQANRVLHAELLAHGIEHVYAEHPGDHGWPYWATHLEDTLKFFDQVLARRGAPT